MNNLLEQTLMQVNIGIILIDHDCNVVTCNDFIVDYTKGEREDIVNKNLFSVYPDLPKDWLKRRIDNIFLLKNSSFISWEQRPTLFDLKGSRPITGTFNTMIQNCSLLPIIDNKHQVTHVCITINDATATALSQMQLKNTSQKLSKEKEAQTQLIEKLEETKDQLLQSEKMASIGQLAAGVAHEINNPVGFIKSNFSSLKHYAAELNSVIQKYENLVSSEKEEDIKAINDEHDIDFVKDDINQLLTESFDGISRIEEIVKSLKHFSRADKNQWEDANINDGIDSTLKIVGHELKYIAEVKKDYGNIPSVQCMPMKVNQVFMNILVNAAQAMDEKKENGKIEIKTSANDEYVIINISDNGKGIDKENIVKIFDPFFTTKDVGKGTGLGLSLSYNIIQDHKGEMLVDSEKGQGTTFTIKLPISQNKDQPA